MKAGDRRGEAALPDAQKEAEQPEDLLCCMPKSMLARALRNKRLSPGMLSGLSTVVWLLQPRAPLNPRYTSRGTKEISCCGRATSTCPESSAGPWLF